MPKISILYNFYLIRFVVRSVINKTKLLNFLCIIDLTTKHFNRECFFWHMLFLCFFRPLRGKPSF